MCTQSSLGIRGKSHAGDLKAVRFAGSEGTNCVAQILQAFDNTLNYTGVRRPCVTKLFSSDLCFYFNRPLSKRRKQAISLHWLDIMYRVSTMTADFRDNYVLQFHCNSDE